MTASTVESSTTRIARDEEPRARLLAALVGLVSGGVTLGVADLAAALASQQTTPVVAVGNVVVRHTPAWLKDFAVERFGTNDKLVLLAGMVVVIAILCAAAGLLAVRHLRLGVSMVLGLDLVAVVAAATDPGTGGRATLPALAGALSGLAAFIVLNRSLRRTLTPWARLAGAEQALPTRRWLLLALLGVGAATVACEALARAIAGRPSGLDPASVRLPTAADVAGSPASDSLIDVPGITPFLTPTADFYRIDTALVVPRIDAGTWSVRVHGMVDREVELRYADLLALPLVERTFTLTCVSNEVGGTLAGNARWLGYPLEALLAMAVPSPDADMVLSSSADGFSVSTPLAALTDGRDALLAVGMNGAPLPAEHGFPARLVVPGLYGYVSATKWVVDLEVTRFDRRQAYWTQRGYAAQAPIRTASRIDVPKPFAQLASGRVAVAGVAWAQHRGIAAVEVRVDGGPWQRARLAGGSGALPAWRDMWRQWVWEWDAPAGLHLLEVRATDADGAVQPQSRRRPAPDGATGWHSVSVTVT